MPATKTKPVTFRARSRNHRVIVIPRPVKREHDQLGNVVGPPLTDPQGVGKQVEFQNWTLTTDDPEIIDALRDHELFGTKHGWYEVYDANRPARDEQFTAIARFAAKANSEGLEELIAIEEAAGDGGREDVLDAAQAALSDLEDVAKQVNDIAADAEATGAGQSTDEPEDPDDAGRGS